jgi:predicted DCC family thiol-disulfide oxidoreductase YuxK
MVQIISALLPVVGALLPAAVPRTAALRPVHLRAPALFSAAFSLPADGEVLQQETPLKVLYDGQCMVCLTNKRLLTFFESSLFFDKRKPMLSFVNIRDSDYDPDANGGIAFEDAMRHFHVRPPPHRPVNRPVDAQASQDLTTPVYPRCSLLHRRSSMASERCTRGRTPSCYHTARCAQASCPSPGRLRTPSHALARPRCSPTLSRHANARRCHHNVALVHARCAVTRFQMAQAGLGWLMAVLRFPLIRTFIEFAYKIVSKYRFQISRWLPGGKALASAVDSLNEVNKGAQGVGCNEEEECMLDYDDDDDDDDE